MIGCGWSVSLRLQPSRIPDPSPLRLLHVHRISPPPPAPSFPISSKRRGTFAVEDRPPPNPTGQVGWERTRTVVESTESQPTLGYGWRSSSGDGKATADVHRRCSTHQRTVWRNAREPNATRRGTETRKQEQWHRARASFELATDARTRPRAEL